MIPKKSLGQHFLHSAYYLGLMADAANVGQSDYIVEVGPGEGALTEVLLTRGATVVASKRTTVYTGVAGKICKRNRQGQV